MIVHDVSNSQRVLEIGLRFYPQVKINENQWSSLFTDNSHNVQAFAKRLDTAEMIFTFRASLFAINEV